MANKSHHLVDITFKAERIKTAARHWNNSVINIWIAVTLVLLSSFKMWAVFLQHPANIRSRTGGRPYSVDGWFSPTSSLRFKDCIDVSEVSHGNVSLVSSVGRSRRLKLQFEFSRIDHKMLKRGGGCRERDRHRASSSESGPSWIKLWYLLTSLSQHSWMEQSPSASW